MNLTCNLDWNTLREIGKTKQRERVHPQPNHGSPKVGKTPYVVSNYENDRQPNYLFFPDLCSHVLRQLCTYVGLPHHPKGSFWWSKNKIYSNWRETERKFLDMPVSNYGTDLVYDPPVGVGRSDTKRMFVIYFVALSLVW